MLLAIEYQHTMTKVFLSNHHIIFCLKRRKAVLVGRIKERLENTILEVASEKHWAVMALEVMPDHVRLFISVEPNTSPNSVVKTFNSRSARYLREELPELIELPSLRTHSYFVSTAGNIPADAIQKYIENQTKR